MATRSAGTTRAPAAAARSTRSATARSAPMKLSIPRPAVRVPGFRFAGVAAGLKGGRRKDLALLVCDEGATAAGAFTTNQFAAPPVLLGRQRIRIGRVRAVLVNTKTANAGTGAAGLVAA